MKAGNDEPGITDINLMIRGFTIFSFIYIHSKKDNSTSWQLVIFNKKKEYNF